jgi:hypothetical protein
MFKQVLKLDSDIISGEISNLKAEIDNFSAPEVNISNTNISRKRSVLLVVIPKILIPFQSLSGKCSF